MADDGPKILNGFDPKTDLIADNYEAGPFLLYDCMEGHWTCVTEEFYRECEKARESQLYAKDRIQFSCAPMAEFANKKSCFQRQLFLTTNNFGQGLCIRDEWKTRSIK